MADEYESFGIAEVVSEDGAASLMRVADKRKRGKRGRAATQQSEPRVSKAKRVARKAAKKPARKQPADSLPSASAIGMITQSMRRLVDGAAAAGGIGLIGWAAVACVGALLALTVTAWRQAPHAQEPRALAVVNLAGEKVPAKLVEQIYNSYPRARELARPDRAMLEDFARHLAANDAIARVERIDIRYEDGSRGLPHQVLEARVAVREPLLPVQVNNDRYLAVDAEGVFLPPMLKAPIDHPRVHGLQAAGRPGLDELLAFWPSLSEAIEPASIASIDLNGDLLRKNQRGIVLHLRSGVSVLWGRPGDDRFGIDHAHKIEQLQHALQCQGAASNDAVIDVRFDQARYVSSL